MKSKTFNKKLSLNKKTVVNLEGKEMTEVLGGDVWSKLVWSCSNCVTRCGSNPCC
jgi:natural product precursor